MDALAKDNDLLTVEEVAEVLRTSPATIYHWRVHGRGPKGTKIGKRVLFRRRAVDEWVASLENDQVAG
jgi:excisionase family DNA binding protein